MSGMMYPPLFPPSYDGTPEEWLGYYAELARRDAEDWRYFCFLVAVSLITLSVMAYVVVGALSS